MRKEPPTSMKDLIIDKIRWCEKLEEVDKDTHNIVYAPSVQHIEGMQALEQITTTATTGENFTIRQKVKPCRQQPYKPKNKTRGAFGGKI